MSPVKSKVSDKKNTIHLWYGENQSLLQYDLDFWQAEFKKRHPQSIIEKISRSDDNVNDRLSAALQSAGLFSDKKLVILFGFCSKNDELSEYIETVLPSLDTGIFLILVDGAKIGAQNKLFKTIKKLSSGDSASIKEFYSLSAKELEGWIINTAKHSGAKISSPVASILGSLVGNDFLRIKQELDKLLAFNNGEITMASLDLLVSRRVEENVFAVVDAIGRRDFKQAMLKLEEQLMSDISPQNVVGTLAWHLRVLWQVREYLDVHKNSSPRVIATDLGIHPYVVNKVLVQIPYYTTKRLQKLYQELSELDTKLKSSRVSPAVLFGLFVSHLATASSVGNNH